MSAYISYLPYLYTIYGAGIIIYKTCEVTTKIYDYFNKGKIVYGFVSEMVRYDNTGEKESVELSSDWNIVNKN
jgi:hypothetical protein